MSKQTNKVDWAIWASFLVVVGATAGAIGVYYIHFGRNLGKGFSEKVEAWAQFGDYFGGLLNPVIAFVAFLWLVRSVKLQQEELRKLNTEIGTTRALQEKQDQRAEEAALIAGLTSFISLTRNNLEQLQKQEKAINAEIYDTAPEYDQFREKLAHIATEISVDRGLLEAALEKQRGYVIKYLG